MNHATTPGAPRSRRRLPAFLRSLFGWLGLSEPVEVEASNVVASRKGLARYRMKRRSSGASWLARAFYTAAPAVGEVGEGRVLKGDSRPQRFADFAHTPDLLEGGPNGQLRPAQYKLFEYAMQLFHNGDRGDAVEILNKLYPDAFVKDRVTALVIACLLGESLRGAGDFKAAQRHYEDALSVGEALPQTQQRFNGFIVHYRPRAQVGLIMALRRQLSPDLERIRGLIDGARNDFAAYAADDLLAQLALLEGLFERQLFQIGTAKSLLEEAYTGVCALDPPYLFLHPDQIEALLVQACLCSPFDRLFAEMRSQQILKRADSGRWSRAVASAVLLQTRLDDAMEQAFSNVTGWKGDMDPLERPEDLGMLEALEKGAQKENDPFLLTEHRVQCLGRSCVRRSGDRAWELASELATLLDRCPEPLILLRAVETSLLWELPGGLGPCTLIDDIRQMGRECLDSLSLQLPAYGVHRDFSDAWAASLADASYSTEHLLECWKSKEMLRLRALSWP